MYFGKLKNDFTSPKQARRKTNITATLRGK